MDRKALIRQYKETPRPMGVFRVHNTVADKSLVGTSRDLPSMLNRQRFQLDHGSHPNHALQEDWNRLGPEAFAFEVLDTLNPADRSENDLSRPHRTRTALAGEVSPLGERGYNAEQDQHRRNGP
jgi:hypothetical protein